MILRIEDLKRVCSTILSAVDSSELSTLTETLELKTVGNILYLNVTNKEYYAQVKLDLGESINFHATVNANLFLNLITQTTSDTVDLLVNDKFLEVKGNGKYKLPLIFDNDKLLELPTISISNITNEFNISASILDSILKYNTKELSKGAISKPVQRLYYVDENGCITFTSGACVNNFTLPQPIKILLNPKLVKLFKLFKDGDVHFTLGQDAISSDLIQTKVKFENDSINITAILNNDDSLINSVPVGAIRGRATDLYDYSIVVNRLAAIDCINRLMLFISGYGTKQVLKPFGRFVFNNDVVIIYSSDENNSEQLDYSNSINIVDGQYETYFDLVELKTTLEGFNSEYVTLRFGNHKAMVIAVDNVLNVVPECHNV